MRTGNWTTSILAAVALAIVITLAGPAIAGDDDDSSYRAEIIKHYVNPCAIDIVRMNPAAGSISDDDITLVARSLMKNPLEEMLGFWIPKVRAMTRAERHAFYKARLEWCIATQIGTKEREGIQDMAEAVE